MAYFGAHIEATRPVTGDLLLGLDDSSFYHLFEFIQDTGPDVIKLAPEVTEWLKEQGIDTKIRTITVDKIAWSFLEFVNERDLMVFKLFWL